MDEKQHRCFAWKAAPFGIDLDIARRRRLRSAGLLVGLGANALLGWWWADPAAALLIAGVALREGREAWHGEACCEAC